MSERVVRLTDEDIDRLRGACQKIADEWRSIIGKYSTSTDLGAAHARTRVDEWEALRRKLEQAQAGGEGTR